MMDKVNEKLPKEEQFGALWWYTSKYQRLNLEYKRLYSDAGLLLKVRVLTALMFACLLVCSFALGDSESSQSEREIDLSSKPTNRNLETRARGRCCIMASHGGNLSHLPIFNSRNIRLGKHTIVVK
jgi:hypothetical protein